MGRFHGLTIQVANITALNDLTIVAACYKRQEWGK